jgi:predicted transposase/invertase (TIGR01784 family)
MQLGKQTFFQDRALFYASHIIRKQAPRTKYWDFNLKAVYIVSILNFITFKEKTSENKVIEQVYLYRKNAGAPFSDKLKMIFIELPKFTKHVTELRTNTDRWLFLLKYTCELQTCPAEIKGKIFKRFLEIAEIKQLTTKEMETYKRSLKQSYQMRDIANCARMEGRTEGRTEGLMQVAVELLKRNTSFEDVVALTKLSSEQLQELLKQLSFAKKS